MSYNSYIEVWFLHPLFLILIFIISVIIVISKYKWKKFIEEMKNYKEDINIIKEEVL
ncbi:MAG: hypothetical protein QW802_04155 [Candidatus Altiarchaeota archaeon]